MLTMEGEAAADQDINFKPQVPVQGGRMSLKAASGKGTEDRQLKDEPFSVAEEVKGAPASDNLKTIESPSKAA